jgi:hypothetical protein
MKPQPDSIVPYVERWVAATQGITSTERTLRRLLAVAVGSGFVSDASLRPEGRMGGRDREKSLAALEGLWRARPALIDRWLGDYFAGLVADRDAKEGGEPNP